LDQTEELLTPAETKALFRVDHRTLVEWVKAGKLTDIRTPAGQHRYLRREVEELRRQSEVQRKP
jgi:predicted site-specific integrase-resolvase